MVLDDLTWDYVERIRQGETLEELAGTLAKELNIVEPEAFARIYELLDTMGKRGMISMHQRTGLHPPSFVFIEVTRKCVYPCRTCVLSAGKPLENELTYAEIKDVIDQSAEMDAQSIVLTGGDPMTHPDIMDILAYIREKGRTPGLSSSLLNLTDENAQRLKEMGAAVQVSIDGTTEEVDDWNRGPGAFNTSLKGIDLLNKYGVPWRLAFSITTKNVEQVEGICDMAKDLGAFQVALRKVKWVGRATNIERDELEPGAEIMADIYKKLYRKSLAYKKDGEKFEINAKYNSVLFSGRGQHPLELNCGMGRNTMHIRSDGVILPCSVFSEFPDYYLGNVRKDRLLDIWHSSVRLEKLRRLTVDNIESCKECDIRYLCGGACRAEALVGHGDFMGECGDCEDVRLYYHSIFKNILETSTPISIGIKGGSQ
ncbi:MAG: radical SAM protein [Thermoplasmata archaeon]|nr:radical SAM protein [Thermoplasmata archaeon]